MGPLIVGWVFEVGHWGLDQGSLGVCIIGSFGLPGEQTLELAHAGEGRFETALEVEDHLIRTTSP